MDPFHIRKVAGFFFQFSVFELDLCITEELSESIRQVLDYL